MLNQHFQKNLYRQQLEQEALKNFHQQELLRSSILVQEQERKRIAQDLHDELGALLSISRMHLVQLEEKETTEKEKLLPALQNIRSITEKALSSMRKISHELMPPQLETFGLTKTLQAVANYANQTGGINIQIDTANDLPELSWPVKLGAYRIIMELINNTIKHSGADKIIIQLQCSETSLECLYTDNGKGFVSDTGKMGLGHKSIEGRASSLGGKFAFGNSGPGFRAQFSIPVSVFINTSV